MTIETRQGRPRRSPVGVQKLLVFVLAGLLLWLGGVSSPASGDAGSAGAACYTLTLNIGGGSGMAQAMPANSGACPAGQYTAGYEVALIATPSGGYLWSGWSGTDNDSANPTGVTMTGDRTATAYFTWNCFQLTLTVGGGSGSVAAMPGSSGGCPAGHYTAGDGVAVIATAGPGYQWSGWSGTDNDSANPTGVTMTSDRTATAYFTSNCYRLTLNVGSGNGSVLALPPSADGCPAGQYPLGYGVSVVATPGTGYQWSGWSGTDNDSANPTGVTMTSDRTATAYFTSNCYRLTLNVGSGNGGVLALPPSADGCPAGQYPLGYAVSLVATPAFGYQWSGWSGTDNDGVNPTGVTITGDRTATAYFVVPGGTPPPTPAPTSAPTSTPTPVLTATPTSTPTSGPTPTGTPTPTPPSPGETDTPAPTPTSTPSPATQEVHGDADCNGLVTAIDAALVLQFGAGLISHVACVQAADANRDGHVNAVDAALILQFGAGLLSGF